MSLPHRHGYATAEEAKHSKAFTANPGATLDLKCPCTLVHVRKPAAAVRPVLPVPRRIPIRAVSAARTAENRLRRKMIAELWPDGQPLCVVYELFQQDPGLVPDSVISRCRRWGEDVHEPLSRARRGGIADPGNAVAPCRACHDTLTFAPESELDWAYSAGLLVHSWAAPRTGGAA